MFFMIFVWHFRSLVEFPKTEKERWRCFSAERHNSDKWSRKHVWSLISNSEKKTFRSGTLQIIQAYNNMHILKALGDSL